MRSPNLSFIASVFLLSCIALADELQSTNVVKARIEVSITYLCNINTIPNIKFTLALFHRAVVGDVWTGFLRWRNSFTRMLSYCILLTKQLVLAIIWSIYDKDVFLDCFCLTVTMCCSSPFQVHLPLFSFWMNSMKSWRRLIFQNFQERSATTSFCAVASLKSQTQWMRSLNIYWMVHTFQKRIYNMNLFVCKNIWWLLYAVFKKLKFQLVCMKLALLNSNNGACKQIRQCSFCTVAKQFDAVEYNTIKLSTIISCKALVRYTGVCGYTSFMWFANVRGNISYLIPFSNILMNLLVAVYEHLTVTDSRLQFLRRTLHPMHSCYLHVGFVVSSFVFRCIFRRVEHVVFTSLVSEWILTIPYSRMADANCTAVHCYSSCMVLANGFCWS